MEGLIHALLNADLSYLEAKKHDYDDNFDISKTLKTHPYFQNFFVFVRKKGEVR